MKITKTYLRKVIKEELSNLKEAEDPKELVGLMVSKLAPLKGKIEAASKTVDLKLALVKALLSHPETFAMDEGELDKAFAMLKRSVQKGQETAKQQAKAPAPATGRPE